MKNEKKKNKEIKVPVKFNPGTLKYEPKLPLKKSNRKLKINVDWKWVIIGVILLIIAIYLISLALKNNLI